MAERDDNTGVDQLLDKVGAMAHDAAAVAVGLGILGINRVQAVRRDLRQRLTGDQPGPHEQ